MRVRITPPVWTPHNVYRSALVNAEEGGALWRSFDGIHWTGRRLQDPEKRVIGWFQRYGTTERRHECGTALDSSLYYSHSDRAPTMKASSRKATEQSIDDSSEGLERVDIYVVWIIE